MVTGFSMSAAEVPVPASAAARRRRSRQAVTLVWPRPSQYSGGLPGPIARAAGWSQPGYLHVVPAAVVVGLVIRASGVVRI